MSMTLIQKLVKCKKSLESHISRGGGLNSSRGYELSDRYDGLRLECLEHHSEEWVTYCKTYDLSVGHTSYDFFA